MFTEPQRFWTCLFVRSVIICSFASRTVYTSVTDVLTRAVCAYRFFCICRLFGRLTELTAKVCCVYFWSWNKLTARSCAYTCEHAANLNTRRGRRCDIWWQAFDNQLTKFRVFICWSRIFSPPPLLNFYEALRFVPFIGWTPDRHNGQRDNRTRLCLRWSLTLTKQWCTQRSKPSVKQLKLFFVLSRESVYVSVN